MSTSGWVVLLALLAGGFALVLAALNAGKPARELARAGLYLSFAIVPVSVAEPLVSAAARSANPESDASQLGAIISTAMSSGVVALMCAFLASLALKRANAARFR